MATDRAEQAVNVEQWQAINERDQRFDGEFFYADRNTQLYCKPSCPSRLPKFNLVCTFSSAEAAEAHGYRPCRRCRPNGKTVTDLEWAGQAERFIHNHYQNPLSVNRIAEACHGPSSELQKIFIRIYGVSLLDYLNRVRMDQARYLLIHSGCFIKQIAELVGMPSAAEFSRKFKEKEGMAPTLYRRQVRKRKREHRP
ncbi:Ada metal-binding domain-containing protein [Trichococcus collinsii]|uniref:AraC family transcriptional regulator, regulatory protein of adaptative response / methylphosphotriester-DNA alkyltransferase methyltransferase n=1 Tax=Trichococcus collinsii TaxID=157076 RepID=A0AB37ZZ41_9LACT|nr:Ada metal-binding domain-containing protein [Trichococcus collinsii]CZR08654.1 helix turn helix arabinose operon control protein [Trichococcus collinsii]SEA20325.1 AraC family transcriptional regulator, regulatory protein of adaptative response / methylphosphotriester-DNA alkyltransferase methyltransferase [Trichococcus collinsii]